MNRYSLIVAMAVLTSMLASPVNADPYIGIGIGTADFKVNLNSLGGSSFEEDGTGTKVYGGYAFNKYYAAEAAYYNFAEASVGAIETSPGSGIFASGSADMKGFSAYAVGMYPVTKKFNLLAKLGAISWDVDLKFNNKTATNDGTDVAYAIAASYAFTKELLVTAEYESFETDNPELTMLSLGFKFIFK